MRYKFYLFFMVLFFLFNLFLVYGDTITYGGEEKWKNIVTQNIKSIYTPYKGYGLTVDYKKSPDKNNLDLYLNFDDFNLKDIIGNYKISYYNFKPYKVITIKGSSGGFFKPEQYVVIDVNRNNFFNNTIDLGSFDFDFYIYPVLISDKTEIIKKGIFYDDKFYGIKVGFKNRKLEVKFENFFYDSENKIYTIILRTQKNISLNKWQHIDIFFDKSTGEVGLIIDDEKADIKYATITGNVNSEILIPHFSKLDGSKLVLFKNFYGYVDEFKVANRSRIDYTEENSGTIESKEIDLKYYNSRVKEMVFKFDEVNMGYIKLFIKTGNKRRDLRGMWSEITTPITNEEITVKNITNIRYLKWKVSLKRGYKSAPILRKVSIKYEKNLKPLAPKQVKVKIFSGDILISWEQRKKENVKGYIIYWGRMSGKYENKLDIGMRKEYILSGLEKGVKYYFVVTSYNSKEPYNESVYSKEVSIYYK